MCVRWSAARPARTQRFHRFLIEGTKGAVLHTGDLRAEPVFLSSLSRNPFVQRYLAPLSSSLSEPPQCLDNPVQTLEAIYLDTACLLSTSTVPTKVCRPHVFYDLSDSNNSQEQATNGLIQLMLHFPSHTRFFINSWTWGYEDILKAVARAFTTKVPKIFVSQTAPR